MHKIRIIDLIGTPNAILHSFGLKVFSAARPAVESGKSVVLDFRGINNVTSAFLHASVGNLVSLTGKKESVLIEGIGAPAWNERIQGAINLALDPSKKNFIDSEISDLFL